MNHNIRDSTHTMPHISSQWPLHHPQATIPVSLPPDSNMSLPGPDTLQSSSRYEPPSTSQPRNVRAPLQRKIPLSLWENNKEEMKRFYMDQDHTLPELIEYMGTLGFKATYGFSSHLYFLTFNLVLLHTDQSWYYRQRQYKEQFKKWKWSKNLTGDIATFMRAKAMLRKQQNPPKDTVFHWRGKDWTTDQVLRAGNPSGSLAFGKSPNQLSEIPSWTEATHVKCT